MRRWGIYGRKVSWIAKRYEKYERNPSWIVKRYGKYRRKVSWIVKRYWNYGRKVSWIANKTAMGLDKKLSQLMDCPLPTNNTHIIMSTKMAHIQI